MKQKGSEDHVMIPIQFGMTEGKPLNGPWGLLPDPMKRSIRQAWWERERQPGQFFPSYDNDAFWPTQVPAAYNLIHPELLYYEGTIVYLHYFEARKPEQGERAFLQFEAVNDRCKVFLNGTCIGAHEGGFTAFTLDASLALQEQNRLLVLVESSRNSESVPGEIHDWFHYGGIIRPVRLYYKPEEYIRQVSITASLEAEEVLLRIRVIMEAPSRDHRPIVELALKEPVDGTLLVHTQIKCTPGSWSEQIVRLPVSKVKLWCTESPFLYRAEASSKQDTWCDEIGIREIRVQGREILLNGVPVALKGVATWTEDNERGIFSMGAETANQTVSLLQELNANFARAGHCPNSAEFVRACDRAGIMLWMEVPAYWIRDMESGARSHTAINMLSAMLQQYGNSASVLLWSIGNESIFHYPNRGESNIGYFMEAADFIRANDPSRLVTYTGGFEGDGLGNVEELYPSIIMRKLDVIGINSYSGIHDGATPGKPDEFDIHRVKLKHAAQFGKPVILAEAGIDAVIHEKGFDYGEERQVAYHVKLQQLFLDGLREGWMQGLCLFVLNDYRTPIKLGRFQRGYNRKGLVTENLQPKPAFYAVRDGYASIDKSPQTGK